MDDEDIHVRRACTLLLPSRKSILNLEELSNLCFSCCTNEVFSSISDLKRLIVHHRYSSAFSVNDIIDMPNLTKLEALKCVSKYFWFSMPPISIKQSFFPTSLRRLTLDGGFCFPWEDISTLHVMLLNLEELKLKDHAANDHVWRLSDETKFESLKFLLFHGLNLKHWEASSYNFPNLRRLVLKKCNKLNEIPTDFGEICTLESIELYQCGVGAEESARKIEQEQEDMGNNFLKIFIHGIEAYFEGRSGVI